MKKANRIKEDERIEGIIRGLLKLPENRRCINCNSLGPQYVCTTFLTFVCTNCSGVHREFTHRVKSVSMAKFTAEEVNALQAAGNERARQIYLKEWDPRRNSHPDGSNLYRIRDFIRHVYVDRKYTGDKRENLPKLRLGEREESYESRKIGGYFGEFRSPRYESRYEQSSSGRSYPGGRSNDRNSRYYHDERRSPSYNQENSRIGGYRKSPVRFEVVDDRFRDNTFGNGRNREYKVQNRSPDHQTNMNSSTSSVVRSIKEILGESAPPLEVGKHSKAIDVKDTDGSANNQKITPSGSMHCVDGNQVVHKEQNLESLINLSIEPEPTDAATAAPQTQQITPSSDGGKQSSNEPSAKEKAPTAPMPNTLEFLLFELSAPSVLQSNDEAPSPVSESGMPAGAQMTTLPTSISASATASTTNMSVQPSGGNMLEASISPSAPVEQLLMLPRCVDVSVTASTTHSPVQRSGVNGPTVGASPTAQLGQISTLPGSFGASTTGSTANVSVHPSGGNMPLSGISPAPPLGRITTLANGIGDSPTLSTTTVPVSPFHRGPPQAAPDINVKSVVKFPDMQRLNSMQPYEPLSSPAADSRSSAAQQITTPVRALTNQPWISSLVPNTQGPPAGSAEQSSQTFSRPVLESSSTVRSEPLPGESKSSGRKELPADLFTASYIPAGGVPQWQTGPPNAMGFNMQYYPNPMLAPAYSSPAKSANPFDINSDSAPMQVPPFPSMASPQGVFPNAGLPHISDIGANSAGSIVPQSSSYTSTMLPQSPPFSSPMSSSTFLGQEVHANMTPPRLQGVDVFGSDRAVFSSSNIPQQPTGGSSVLTTENSFCSMGGNPFG